METRERLVREMEILSKIDSRREKESAPGLGEKIEREILNRELRELEKDILADPGALESQLVRVRPRKSSAVGPDPHCKDL
jgi:hypothetical protein